MMNPGWTPWIWKGTRDLKATFQQFFCRMRIKAKKILQKGENKFGSVAAVTGKNTEASCQKLSEMSFLE